MTDREAWKPTCESKPRVMSLYAVDASFSGLRRGALCVFMTQQAQTMKIVTYALRNLSKNFAISTSKLGIILAGTVTRCIPSSGLNSKKKGGGPSHEQAISQQLAILLWELYHQRRRLHGADFVLNAFFL